MTTKQTTIPILMYHSIAQPVKGAPFKCLHVPPSRFRWHMRLLKLLGYQGLSVQALAPYLRGEKSGKVVGITFDDGYRNNLTAALPVLKHYGFTATCYIVSDYIGQHNIWDEVKNIPKNPLMTTAEIEQWLAAGMSIGGHTKTHIDLTTADDNTAFSEIADSRAFLQQQFNHPVTDFCYPYGKHEAKHIEMVREAGFTTAMSMHRARSVVGKDDLLALPRVTVNNNAYPHIFLAKLLTAYEDKKGQKLRQRQANSL